MRAEEARGVGYVLLSTLAYGAMPVISKVAYARGLTPRTLLAWRFLIALGLLSLLQRRAPRLPWRTRASLWGLGSVFVGNAYAYFRALESIPASTLSLLLYTYPVIVTLLSAGAGLEPFRLRSLAAAAMAFGGCALTAGGDLGSIDAGVWLALLAALVYAFYIVLSSRFAAGVPAETAAGHVVQVCAVFYAGAAALGGELLPPAAPSVWAALFVLALFCTVLPLRAFLLGLERIGPARAAVLSSLEVLVTLGLAVLVLDEWIAPRQLVGAVLILAGVVLQNVGALRSWRRA